MTELWAYEQINPPEEVRGDLRASLIAHLICATNATSKRRVPDVSFFMRDFFNFQKDLEPPKKTYKQLVAALNVWKGMVNAVYDRKKAQVSDA